jgi:chromosome partitioning protein
MKTIAFFNNKGGVGKTSLVYHLSWMFSELKLRVLAVDLDPQANLTSMFLNEERLEEIWSGDIRPTINSAIKPLIDGLGDIQEPHIENIDSSIGLLVGDLELSICEDELSKVWPDCSDRKARAFRVTSAFSRLIQMAGEKFEADVALIDVGPNLGAINRCALLSCNYVVVPLGPDLFSLQGLRNMGPALRRWREEWRERMEKNPDPTINLPQGEIEPVGYIIMRHSVRLDRPVKSYARWIEKMPRQYCVSVLNLGELNCKDITVDKDSNCLAQLKDYRSLMPIAQEVNKPMFLLRPADGAFGGHQKAVGDCYSDFKILAERIAAGCKIALHGSLFEKQSI